MVTPGEIEVGDWLIVIPRFEKRDADGVITQRGSGSAYWSFAGVPFRVDGVCLPFIMISFDRQVARLDTRDVDLAEPDRRYRKAFERQLEIARGPAPATAAALPLEPNQCPNCRSKLRQRRTGDGVWTIVCPHCGHEQRDGREANGREGAD